MKIFEDKIFEDLEGSLGTVGWVMLFAVVVGCMSWISWIWLVTFLCDEKRMDE